MSSLLGFRQTIELLDRLKSVARECAAAEDKLEQEFRARQAQSARATDAAREDHETRLSADLAQADAAFETARRTHEARAEHRQQRIRQAHQSSKRQALAGIEQEEGRRKYAAQKGLMDTERRRKEQLAQNDAALADFNQQLAVNREEFVQREHAAATAARGYPRFVEVLAHPPDVRDPDLAPDEYALFEQLRQLLTQVDADLARFNRLLAPRLFRYVALWLWVLLVAAGVMASAPILRSLGIESWTYVHAAIAIVPLVLLVIGAYVLGRRRARPLALRVAQQLEVARRLHNACLEKAQARHQSEIARIESEARDQTQHFEQDWQAAVAEAAAARDAQPPDLELRAQRIALRHDQSTRAAHERLAREHAAVTGRIRHEAAQRHAAFTAAHAERQQRLESERQARWAELEADWRRRVQPIYEAIRAAQAAATEAFPPWDPPRWEHWTPPATFQNAARVGRLEVDLPRLAEALPRDSRLALPGPAQFALPLVLTYPQQGSVLFETTRGGNEAVVAALNSIIFRLLAASPPGKASFTIIDPIRLGENFAGIMHLADFEDNLINGRIWTQPAQIEQRLADLNEHMEKVIQMYLRNEYATIAEYNAQAGNIAEKYHFVVIADFPANFSEAAARRLLHIAASGARCGVYTLIHWDHRQSALPEFFPEELRKNSVCIQANGGQFALAQPALAGTRVLPDAPPAPELATAFLQQVGESSRGANRVEVPFVQVAPSDAEMWTLETTDELRVAIGRSGATKLQYLAIGKGTRQHGLVAGKTGSGKSTLFHVVITNLALWCSPEQIEFYLVDFKKGVEFKSYANRRLPQARVVAIESDREFALSVLQRVDEELRTRGDRFRQLGVQDLAGYRRAVPTQPMPRTLLIIDEFQEFFVEDDRVSQAAAVLLDRIVRQGRAFGIHVLLGSQTLGGAYTLARATIGQMVIRIALQCNEADAYLIMDENNAAPRLLSRPGEGIYNDMAGMQEGNSPFQAVWLSDHERDGWLERVRARTDENAYPGPIVFEGNAPADVRENHLLRALLEAKAIRPQAATRTWLGAPNAIKGPTEVVFQNRTGNHLLIVGQRDEAVLAMLTVALVSLPAQYAPGQVRFVVLESTAPDSPERSYLERVIRGVPHEVVAAKSGELPDVMRRLAVDLDQRMEQEGAAAPATFLLIHGLQNFKKFRQDDDFSFSMDDAEKAANPAAVLGKLVTEGASHGMHVIATTDTFNNVNRFLGRKALSQFELRVLFQMSTNDSASLCDDPKASTLGLHRALLYNEQEGYLETFRPYALPSQAWLETAAQNLARLTRA